MRKRDFYLCLTVLWLILLFYLSTAPSLPGPVIPSFNFSLRHLSFYFLFSFLIYKSTKNLALAIFLSGTYGLLLETLQFTLPYRTFDVLDIVANYCGAVLILTEKILR